MGDRHSAVKFFNTAVTAVNDTNNPQRLTHAYQLFCSACLTDPTWWEAPYTAGNNSNDLNHPKETSVAYYRRALECEMNDLDRAKVLTNIAWKLHQLGSTEEALTHAAHSIKLYESTAPRDTGHAYSYVNLSCIHQVMGDTRLSLKMAQEAYRIFPDDPTVQTQYAFALLFDRRLSSGMKAFESRFSYELRNFNHFPYPKWEGEEGKTIYLIADQGLGDTLCYARWLPMAAARSKYVHAFVQPELLDVFSHAFVGIKNLNLTPQSTPFPPADHWTTFVSLPYALGLSDSEIRDTPWVDVPIYGTTANWRIPDRRYHVGIHWAGSPLNKIDPARNVPVEIFNELARVPGVQLYSLQVGPRHMDMHNAGMSGMVVDLTPRIRRAVDTAGLLQQLDLVIAVESFLPHLCAAIDKECWMPYSYLGLDYRVGVLGDDRLWSPRHRIFKQGRKDTWEDVFSRIVTALDERVNEERKAA